MCKKFAFNSIAHVHALLEYINIPSTGLVLGHAHDSIASDTSKLFYFTRALNVFMSALEYETKSTDDIVKRGTEKSDLYQVSTTCIYKNADSNNLNGCNIYENSILFLLCNAELHVSSVPVGYKLNHRKFEYGPGYILEQGFHTLPSYGLKHKVCSCTENHYCNIHHSDHTGSSFIIMCYRNAMVAHLDERERKQLLALGYNAGHEIKTPDVGASSKSLSNANTKSIKQSVSDTTNIFEKLSETP